ncbi:hypothetical protein KIN20_031935 [Parelaphostrongylus tenuis]|uniref:Uncharacterized protein n=1 Tax=Parelaphostrongylus tenuis TaxID=148309 RepID=A0AAD5R675_PARTN|nr:hypothetical protein KIN20_031935 [Parelaphostrongylus tenuis]
MQQQQPQCVASIAAIASNQTQFQELSRYELNFFVQTLFLRRKLVQTTNIIMANWSRMMWQSVLNRAIRMLASGPFGSHFFSATATVCRT